MPESTEPVSAGIYGHDYTEAFISLLDRRGHRLGGKLIRRLTGGFYIIPTIIGIVASLLFVALLIVLTRPLGMSAFTSIVFGVALGAACGYYSRIKFNGLRLWQIAFAWLVRLVFEPKMDCLRRRREPDKARFVVRYYGRGRS
jgi:hypothetical protein